MTDLLTDVIVDLIGSVDGAINSAFNSLMNTCFNAEYELTHILGDQVISLESLKTLIFSFALSLIILKFLKKVLIYIFFGQKERQILHLLHLLFIL